MKANLKKKSCDHDEDQKGKLSSPLDIVGGRRIYDPVLDNHITCHVAAGTRQKAAQACLQQFGTKCRVFFIYLRDRIVYDKIFMHKKNSESLRKANVIVN
jgi:hypothetical protein